MSLALHKALSRTARSSEGKPKPSKPHELSPATAMVSAGVSPLAPRSHPVRTSPSNTIIARFSRPVKSRDLCVLTSQMALMLETGNTLVESIQAIANQIENDYLARILGKLNLDISGGLSLSQALESHPRVFNQYFVATIRAAETSGDLVEAFKRLETQLQKREEFVSSLRAALIYPIILTLLSTSAVIFLIAFVVPKFAVIFSRGGVLLPLPSRKLWLAGTDYRPDRQCHGGRPETMPGCRDG